MARKDEALAHLTGLADLYGIDLQDQRIAIASRRRDAIVRSSDGSLEATINVNEDAVRVMTPRSPGIAIRLVNRNDMRAPKDAIYEITTYRNEVDGAYALNGDVYSVYVGPDGFLLDNAARRRVAELPDLPPREH